MTGTYPFRMWPVLTGIMAAALFPDCSCDGSEVLDEVRAGNRAAIESIRSLYCRVTKSSPISVIGPVPESTAECWWSSKSSRVRVQERGQFSDSVIHDFTFRSLSKRREPNGQEKFVFYISRQLPDEPHTRFDPWARGLLKLCGPKGMPLTLNELLNRSHELQEVRRATQNGQEFIVVHFSLELHPGETGNFEVWFDPQVNYLACKLIGTSTGSAAKPVNRRKESRVLSFREVAPTVYFPEHVESHSYKAGQLVGHEIVRFSDVRVNEPLPPDIFKIAIPPGVHVLDSIADLEYRTNANGQQIGPGRALAKFPPLQAGAGPLAATSQEPQPATRWIVPVSLAILTVGGGLWFVRKWRSSLEAASS